MMPIKIRCGCGQKYAFEVEPVDGLMGSAVQCPVCGVDGTSTANRLITERLGVQTNSAPALRLGKHESIPAAQPPIPRCATALTAPRWSPGTKVRKTWPLRAACGAMVLLVLGAILLGRSVGLNQKSGNVGDQHKDGFPHTLAELNAWYVEPHDQQNAATFFSAGIKALHIANVESSGVPLLGKGKLPPLGGLMPVSLKSALTAFVGSNREALQFFARGAKFDQSRYPVDLSLGVEAAFPHLTRMKEAGQVLELAAVWHADANDAKSSADDIASALALGNSLRAEPYLFSQLMRAKVASIAVAGLEQSLNRALWTAADLARIFNLLQKMQDYDANGEGFGRGVIGERVATMALLGKPEKFLELLPVLGADISPDRRAKMATRLQSGKLQSEEYYFDRAMIRFIEARQRPFPDRLKADDMIRQQIDDAASKQLVLAEFLLSDLSNASAKEAECLASLRLGLAAIALEQFRAEHDNRYPATLSELTPVPFAATPMDPYDGQPLRYKTKSDGYVLYSIGPDLEDNFGGRMKGKEGDIVFAVVIPPKAQR
jgi:hypothetical protein